MKNTADEASNDEISILGGEPVGTLEEISKVLIDLGVGSDNPFVYARFSDGNTFTKRPPVNGVTEVSIRVFDAPIISRQQHDDLFENFCEERYSDDDVVKPGCIFTLRDYVESKGISWGEYIGTANTKPIDDVFRVESLLDDYYEVHGWEGKDGKFMQTYPTFSSYLKAHGL